MPTHQKAGSTRSNFSGAAVAEKDKKIKQQNNRTAFFVQFISVVILSNNSGAILFLKGIHVYSTV